MQKIKKLTAVLLSAIMVLSVFAVVPFTVNAAAYKYGDFTYTILNQTDAEITGYNGDETNVTIPSQIDGYKVTSIGDSAFEGYTNLTSVNIPNSVKRIGKFTFLYCKNLLSIIIPDCVTIFDIASFGGCTNLTSVVIGKGVTTIPPSAFQDCKKLENITIPDNVISIGFQAFAGCTNLNKITIPNSVIRIGNNAIYSSDKITIYGYTGTAAETYAKENGFKFKLLTDDSNGDYKYEVLSEDNRTCEITGYTGSETDLHIPFQLNGYTVTRISGMDSNYKLKSVWIPNSVTELKGATFWNCANLECVVIGNGITSISDSVFHECTSLQKVVLHSNVSEITRKAFWDARVGCIIYGYKGSSAEDYAIREFNSSSFQGIGKFYSLPTIAENNELKLFYSMQETTIEEVIFALYINRDINLSSLLVKDAYGNFITDYQQAVTPGMEFSFTLVDGTTTSYFINSPTQTTEPTEPSEPTEPGDLTDDIIAGDSNGDGRVSVLDATLIQKYSASIEELTGDKLTVSDVNKDGVVNVLDATEIQKYLADLPSVLA